MKMSVKLPLVSSPSKSRGRGGGFRSKSPSSRNSRRSASPSRGDSASPSKRRGKPASITQLRKESPFAIPDDDAVVIERRKEIDDAKLLRRQARRTGGNGNATASLSATNTASLARSQSQSRRIESPSRRRTRRAEEASSDGGFMVLGSDDEDEAMSPMGETVLGGASGSSRLVDLEASSSQSPDEARRRRARKRQLYRTQQLLSSVSSQIASDARRDKDDIKDFIDKKRQVFYTQMALDVKNKELMKLRTESDQRTEWVRKMELLLEEDTVRFDTFFKENHAATKDAIQRSELMTAKKRESMSVIKHTMLKVQEEMTQIEKLRASVGECLT